PSFLTIPPPPTPTLFPTRRSSDLDALKRRCCQPSKNSGSDSFPLALLVRASSLARSPKIRSSIAPISATSSLALPQRLDVAEIGDRKSTRLNSSHVAISYAVFCLK